MRKKVFVLPMALVILCFAATAFAGTGSYAKAKHADKNKDGVVDKKEKKMEKKWEEKHWKKERARVTNGVENKYDQNNNGWIDPEEARKMLQDKYQVIKTDGRAKVDTTQEAEYDSNNDGIIDASEAKALLNDIK